MILKTIPSRLISTAIGWKPKGTTLGADNGMGVAAIMAVLGQHTEARTVGSIDYRRRRNRNVWCIRLETGYGRWRYFVESWFGRRKVNYISVVQAVKIWLLLWNTKEGKPTLMISLWKWLWKDFAAVTRSWNQRSRANANKLMARFMNQVDCPRWGMLGFMAGVEICNTIPRGVRSGDYHFRLKKKQMWWNMYKNARLCGTKNIMCTKLRVSFKAERVELPAMMVPDEIRDNLVDAIYACQNGVSRMIPTIPDTVETSSNLAIVTIGGGKAEIKILTRSSRDSMKDYLNTSLNCCFLYGRHGSDTHRRLFRLGTECLILLSWKQWRNRI